MSQEKLVTEILKERALMSLLLKAIVGFDLRRTTRPEIKKKLKM